MIRTNFKYEWKISAGQKLVFAVILLLPLGVFGQDSSLGNWLMYLGNKKINDTWNWHHEIQYRNYDAIGDLEQLLIRTGVGRNLSEKNNNLLVGYAYIHSQNYVAPSDDKTNVDEHRIFQQFITRQHFGRVFLQHRYRFEQRFVEDDFSVRFRYFLAVNIPINHNLMLDKTFYLSSYNEIFLTTGDQVFDRNRLYGGLGYRVNERIRFEAGYMNQFLMQKNRDQLNLIVFVNL